MTTSFYTLALFLGFGSWFIVFIEMIATHSFLRLVFNIGIPIIKRTIEIPTNNFTPNIHKTIEESEGKFCFTIDREVLFLSQFFWFNWPKLFRFNTPFPFKTVGKINENNTIDLIVRLPIGSCLFLLFWIIACTISSLENGIQSGENGFGLMGWIFTALIIGISYLIEKNRWEIMIEELKKIICSQKKTI